MNADPGASPLTDPHTTDGKRAIELHKRWSDQHARIDALTREAADAKTALGRADDELRDALYAAELRGGRASRKLDDLTTARALAEARAREPWPERVQAAQRAATERRREYAAFVDEHLEALLREPELAEAAQAAKRRVLDSLTEVEAAHASWLAVRRKHAALVSHATGINDYALPMLDTLAAAFQELNRIALEGDDSIPSPAPSPESLLYRRELRETGAAPSARVPA